METRQLVIQEVNVVELIGDLDGSSAPIAQATVLPLVQPGGAMVLDMTRVAYMSSAGLRMLLSIHRTVLASGARIVLVGLSEDIRDTMSATGFLNFFVIEDTLEQGLHEIMKQEL